MKTYSADRRLPIEKLFEAHDSLLRSGLWEVETVFLDRGLPSRVFHTKKKGPALWVLAGIHGEEPAPPNAVARDIARFDALAAQGIPVVLFPLCNPVGYVQGWRYPDSEGRSGAGHSVGDSDHLLPDKAGRPRLPKPASPQGGALTAKVLALSKEHPPVLSVDLHEDDTLAKGYLYSQGPLGRKDPAAKAIIAEMRRLNTPIQLTGKSGFDEIIEGGVIADVQDGSVDELLAAKTVLAEGRPRPGPGARSAIVVETSTMKAPIEERVRVHSAVIGLLESLYLEAKGR